MEFNFNGRVRRVDDSFVAEFKFTTFQEAMDFLHEALDFQKPRDLMKEQRDKIIRENPEFFD